MSEIPTTLFNEWVAYHVIEPPDSIRISQYLIQLTAYVVSFMQGKEANIDDLILNFGKEFLMDEEDHGKEIEVKMKAALASFEQRFPGAIKKVE